MLIVKIILTAIAILLSGAGVAVSSPAVAPGPIFCCKADNDLFRAYSKGMGETPRYEDALAAVNAATTSSGVLLLADDYPNHQTQISPNVLLTAIAKDLRLYIEFPDQIPGLEIKAPKSAQWERLVINSPMFGSELPPMSILTAHACVFLPVETSGSLIAIGRVAGFDKAVYGIPDSSVPALLQVPGRSWIVATTGLSHFQRGRFAPSAEWTTVWTGILKHLEPAVAQPHLTWEPVVQPSFRKTAALEPGSYRDSLQRLVRWYLHSGIMPDEAGEKMARSLTKDGIGTASLSAITSAGDGKHGILEAFESTIQPDGSQNFLVPLRADCNAETAMVLGLSRAFTGETSAPAVAANLLDYIYSTSGMCGGERGDPNSPAYGLIAWGMGSDAWERANYGDDNARTLLATIATAGTLNIDRWNTAILRGVIANFRTTGKNGLRGDRIDMPELRRNGWRSYFDGAVINNSPHFEAYLWACYLWAYRATGYQPLLERARAGMGGMMKTFPGGWRRNDMIDLSKMVLPLAWLVRVDDSPQSRQWLQQVCDELLRSQDACGALPERENGGAGHYQAPKSNEEYGTAETPLIHQTGDKATDQLYSTGFALIGLHEAAAATGDPKLKAAEDKLANYLLRIQTRSSNPRCDGVWFRAFDYGRWDYWASSGDLGWGAWVIETGWGQSWIAATFALRETNSTLWDLSSKVNPRPQSARILKEMGLENVPNY